VLLCALAFLLTWLFVKVSSISRLFNSPTISICMLILARPLCPALILVLSPHPALCRFHQVSLSVCAAPTRAKCTRVHSNRAHAAQLGPANSTAKCKIRRAQIRYFQIRPFDHANKLPCGCIYTGYARLGIDTMRMLWYKEDGKQIQSA
jgi:hypothetical protein